MFRITKRFSFSASHVLEGMPKGHPCGRLHGHNYVVEVELEADQLDERGMVTDYGKLAWFKVHLDTAYDHRHLNDVMICNPTAENLAADLFVEVRRMHTNAVAVRVSETPKTWAEYRP